MAFGLGMAQRNLLLGTGKQPSGPCATQNTVTYRQHLGTVTKAGGECGQNAANQKPVALHPLVPGCCTEGSSAECTILVSYSICMHRAIMAEAT